MCVCGVGGLLQLGLLCVCGGGGGFYSVAVTGITEITTEITMEITEITIKGWGGVMLGVMGLVGV